MQQDLNIAFFCALIIAIAVTIIQLLIYYSCISKLIGRKTLHIIAISTCAYCIANFSDRYLLAMLFAFFFIALVFVVHKKWLQVSHRISYGIAFFPLAFALLLVCPLIPINDIVFAALCLAICDALAGIVGEHIGKTKIIFWSEGKTLVGFLTFFLASFILAIVFFQLYSYNGIVAGFSIAFIIALTELFSKQGSDNLSVPIVAAVTTLLVRSLSMYELLYLLFLNPFLVLACWLFIRCKWLTFSGAIAALWMAQLIFIAGGMHGFVIPIFFLICGSLVSKLNKHGKEKHGRNAIQVFANGLVGVACLLVFKLTAVPIFLFCSIVSFCISMTDTCSSEIGVYFKQPTRDVLTFKRVLPGLSGGISFAGTLGGLVGGILFTCFSYFIWPLKVHFLFVCILFGVLGMLLDSAIGSRWQVKFGKDNTGLMDHFIPGTIKMKGYYWCTNDVVNIFSNAVATFVFYVVYKFLSS